MCFQIEKQTWEDLATFLHSKKLLDLSDGHTCVRYREDFERPLKKSVGFVGLRTRCVVSATQTLQYLLL